MAKQLLHGAYICAPFEQMVANECLSVCGVTGLAIFARIAARLDKLLHTVHVQVMPPDFRRQGSSEMRGGGRGRPFPVFVCVLTSDRKRLRQEDALHAVAGLSSTARGPLRSVLAERPSSFWQRSEAILFSLRPTPDTLPRNRHP